MITGYTLVIDEGRKEMRFEANEVALVPYGEPEPKPRITEVRVEYTAQNYVEWAV